jgi:hypothetical protein
MRTIVLQKETLAPILDPVYNPPNIQNQTEENLFQAEIKELYDQLIEYLSLLGEEGDLLC